MDPFCQQHIIPCGGKLQDALRPYTVGGQQQSVTDRLIFTDAPQHFNTVPLREELLASALLGSSSRKALVHEVLQANNYILTLDYTMKMLHLEVQSILNVVYSDSCSEQTHSVVPLACGTQ